MTGPVAIAISSFRSDAAVITLLADIFTSPNSEVGMVIVVDSLGSGKIAQIAEERQWPIIYENSDANLGSAGNLARRMELAAQAGAKWCLCLNHDANWDADRLSKMLSAAGSRARVGAVYPILDHSPREPRWEEGRRHFQPYAGTRLNEIPSSEISAEVLWSSSNFALYSLEPLSENISIMADLWMGYEDLAYGIALHKGGWAQISCRSAHLGSVFDYAPRKFFGKTFFVPDKPTWYSYYNCRNLIMIWRKYGSDGVSLRSISWKFIHSLLRIMLFDSNKLARLHFLCLGVVAGIAGEGGKGPVP